MAIAISPIYITYITCNGLNNGSIVITPGGGTGPYKFQWFLNGSPYSTDQNIYSLAAGNYDVIVTDSLGATYSTIANSSTIALTQPAVINPNLSVYANVVCHGGAGTVKATPSGGTGSYTYLWSNSATTQSIVVGSGTYSVVVTDSNGCTGTASIYLPDASAVVVEIQQDLEQCYNEAITLTANVRGGTGPYTVLWSPNGETTLSVNAVPQTTYTCTATDSNSCTGATQIYIPSQYQAWMCCLSKKYGAKAQALINGDATDHCPDIDLVLLYLNIQATERFSRKCLTAQQQQIILDSIDKQCNCGCGNVAQQQQL